MTLRSTAVRERVPDEASAAHGELAAAGDTGQRRREDSVVCPARSPPLVLASE